jgi:hypothetical protein
VCSAGHIAPEQVKAKYLHCLTNLAASPYLFLDHAGDGEPAQFYRAFGQEFSACGATIFAAKK